MSKLKEFLTNHRGGYNTAKLTTRCCSIFVGVVIISLGIAYPVAVTRDTAAHLGKTGSAVALPIALLSISVDALELASGFVKHRHHGIHPGWHIFLELVLFAGSLAATFHGPLRDLDHSQDASVSPDRYLISPSQLSFAIFTSLLTVLRFVLGVMASVDIHRHDMKHKVERLLQMIEQANHPETSGGNPHDIARQILLQDYDSNTMVVPPQEMLSDVPRSPQELHNQPAFDLELQGDRHPAELDGRMLSEGRSSSTLEDTS